MENKSFIAKSYQFIPNMEFHALYALFLVIPKIIYKHSNFHLVYVLTLSEARKKPDFIIEGAGGGGREGQGRVII